MANGPNTDHFLFPNGSVAVNHQPTKQTNGPTVACISFFGEKGNYQLAGGTGQYAGATGSGTYTVSGVFFGKTTKNGGCSQHGGTQIFNVFANGHTTLP